jgi:hypothetical protein
MEPMRSVGGEEAARKAALEFVPGGDDDDGEYSDTHDQSERTGGVKVWRFVERFCVILLLPFLWLYDCFVFVIGARLYRWVQTLFVATRRQAHLFLNGMKPYQCSVNMTAVHLTVLCSGWYMFIDQARLAFMPVHADYTLAIINFVIWSILVIELVFEVFIRPDRFSELIVSDKAFTPTTVRFISFLHLMVETISLVFFVPEFVCLFTDRQCDDRSQFSFLNAALLTITSTNRIQALVGRVFFACIRLRVFGLVRHWKNMLVKKTFIMRFRNNKNYDPKGRPQMYKHAEGTNHGELEEGEPLTAAKKRSLAAMAKAREAALVNASNIGTALMVTNSYRTLLILCAIMGLFPMISLIHLQGVTNPVASAMINQLQATNAMAVNEDVETCDFLVDSVETWVKSWDSRQHRLATSKTDKFLVSLVIQPARCVSDFFSLGLVGDDIYVVDETPCQRVRSQYGLDVVATGECITIRLAQAQGQSLREDADELNLRFGAIQSASSESVYLPMEYQNVSTTQIVPFKVIANFNHTYSVEAS